MEAQNVSQMCLWIDCTEFEIFHGAYLWYFGYESRKDIETHIIEFSLHNTLPDFVYRYIKTVLYPRFVIH